LPYQLDAEKRLFYLNHPLDKEEGGNMLRRSLRPIVLALACFAFLTISSMTLFGTFAAPMFAMPRHSAEVVAENLEFVEPLPPGCINGTPAGEEAPVCCISGLVYVNGQPVRGANVTIQHHNGKQVVVQTDLQLDTERRPYYRQNLSRLAVVPGDKITLTANFSGYTRTVTHTVQANGQQVDIALAPDGLSFVGETQGEAEDGKFNNVVDVATDSQGRIYGTDLKNFRVLVFNPDGTWVNKWGGALGNLPIQFGRPMGIAIDKRTDIVYVVDRDNHRILKYSAAGDLIEVWDNADLPSNQPWLGAPKDVTVDGAGNVYILSRSGITKFDETGKFLDHWGAYSDGSTDRADLDHLAASPTGDVYVPDPLKHIIHKFDSNGSPRLFSIQTTTGTLTLNRPVGIAVDDKNLIYIYEQGRSRLLVVNANGDQVKSLPEATSNPGDHFPQDVRGISVYDDKIYLAGFNESRIVQLSFSSGNFITPSIGGADNNAKQIERPRGLAIGAHNNLFVTEPDLRSLSLIISDVVTQSWTASDLGLPPWSPVDVAFANQQELWVADYDHGLRRLVVNGQQLTKNGAWDGIQPGIDFCHPTALDIDPNGNIFVVDGGCNPTVYAVFLNNGVLQLRAAFTSSVESGPLNIPLGIALDDATAMIYVADSNNHRIVQLHFTGSAFAFVRTWGEPGSGPGQLNQPWNILVGQDGFLYVSDRGNHRIQKFDKTGTWLASYGAIGIGPGDWLNPTGLVIDDQGILHVADEGLGRIQRLAPVSNTVPIATIIKLSATDLKPTAVLTATGQGQDSDATNLIRQYKWSSNRQGVLQSGNNPMLVIAATQLISGPHLLSLRVQDDEDVWSIPVSVRIHVIPTLRSTACQAETWTLLLYLVGDYQDDGQLQEIYDHTIANLKGLTNPCVKIGVQMDGSTSIGSSGSDTRRWLIQPGADPIEYALSEQEMDDPATLTTFISDTQKLLPAQRYYLAIANHGQGILGIGWDHTTDYRRNPPLIENDTYLTAKEIATALADPRLAPIDILHLDACSMGLLDVAYELRNSARYLIAAQYLGWSIFAYDAYAALVPQTTTLAPADLAAAIVDHYADVAAAYQLPYTLSALDLGQTERIKAGVDVLAVLLRGWTDVDLTPTQERTRLLLALRDGSQIFNSDADLINTTADRYVDLLDWVTRIQAAPQIDNPAIKIAAAQLIALLQVTTTNRFVVANRVGSDVLYINNQFVDLSRAGGVSLYLPPGEQLQYGQDYAAYLQNRLYGLTVASRWDSFLQTVLGAPGADDPLAALPLPLAPLALPPLTPPKIFLPLIQR